jgi:hypothetical protein
MKFPLNARGCIHYSPLLSFPAQADLAEASYILSATIGEDGIFCKHIFLIKAFIAFEHLSLEVPLSVHTVLSTVLRKSRHTRRKGKRKT